MPITIDKISKLLTQAENAGTEAEAATFLEAAQRLAAANSIDLAKARHLGLAKEKTLPTRREFIIWQWSQEQRHKPKGLKTYTDLMIGILEAQGCRVLIAGDATRVYGHGFPEDLAVAEALYHSTLVQMVKASEEYKKLGEWKHEQVWSDNLREYKTISWLTARLAFQGGYARRIRERLKAAAQAAKIESERAQVKAGPQDTTDPGTAIVLAEKAKQVDEFFSTYRRSARGSYGGFRGNSGASSAAGASAADRASLGGRSTSLGGARKALGA